MYRLGHHRKHRYWLYTIAGIVALGCLITGIITARHGLQARTTLSQAPPVVRHIAASDAVTHQIVKDTFTIDLPADWRAVPPPAEHSAGYSWRGTSGGDAARRLDVYIDQLPQTLAVNRLLPVEAIGNRLNVLGVVSENCVTFTDKSAAAAATGTAPAKWGGVNFICDTGNYERDVVAVGSAQSVNAVSVTGPGTGAHRVLLVYTDNSADPDYAIFTAIVRSFRAV